MPFAVILTAIRVEYLAVRSHLIQIQEAMHPHGTIYERGKFVTKEKEWEIGIIETGAGNSPAGIEAERAIAFFKPDVILFVGVAGGIKDVKLGDVVAGTKVYGYESGKVEGERFKPRPNVGESSYNLVQRARFEGRNNDWLDRISIESNLNPTVLVAPIAAGEKVVADRESELFQFLRDNYGDAIAVEMEGRGVLQAAYANQQVSALIIRGISDLIKGKSQSDEEGYQEIAAHHASAFAFQVLAKFNPSGTTEEVNQPQGEIMSNPNDSSSGESKVTKNYDFRGASFGGGFADGDYTGDVINYSNNSNDSANYSNELELKSEVGIDYTKLCDLLKAGNWQEADKETRVILKQILESRYEGFMVEFPLDNLMDLSKLKNVIC
ncbi:MAG: hypothetical protein AB4041_16545 [Microcystaceae cyanobacterium]